MTERIRPFAGTTEVQTDAAPEWYVEQMNDASAYDTESFESVISQLHEVAVREVFTRDEETGEFVRTDNAVALVNPAKEGTTAERVYNTATNAYDPVQPTEIFEPLLEAASEHGAGEQMFGHLRGYDYGGVEGSEVHADMFFPEWTVDLPGESPDVILGVQAGYDYKSGTRIYAEPIALNTGSQTVMRSLADAHKRSHRKSPDKDDGETADEVAAWWGSTFERLDRVSDTLFQVVMDADEHMVSFEGIPFSPADGLRLMGLPEGLANYAAAQLPGDTENTHKEVSAWELHEAAMLALTEHYDGKTDGKSMKDHVALANRWLTRPNSAEQSMYRAMDEELQTDEEQTTLGFHPGKSGEEHEARKEIRERAKTVAEKAEEEERLSEKVRRMMDEAETPDDEDEQGADGEEPAQSHADDEQVQELAPDGGSE